MKKIYIGNIAYNATEEDINELFSKYGEIKSLKIIKDSITGRSRGFGFIEMANENDAKDAISALNGKTFMEKTLNVAEARPQQKRQGFDDRRSSYGGGMRANKNWR
jgi:RNA recognition motif-containing protein